MKTLRKLNLLSVILFQGLGALQSKHRVYDPTFQLRSLSLDTAAMVECPKGVSRPAAYSTSGHSVNKGKCPSEMICIHWARSPSVRIAACATTEAPALSRIILMP